MQSADHITYLSKKGLKDLKKSISQLERDLSEARLSLKDIDKTSSREERMMLSEKLSQIETIESELEDKRLLLSNAKPLPKRRHALRVALGSVVDLIDSTGQMVRYQIVDSLEADPSDGRISVNSPLGKSLLGRQIQETVESGRGLKLKRLTLIGIR